MNTWVQLQGAPTYNRVQLQSYNEPAQNSEHFWLTSMLEKFGYNEYHLYRTRFCG